jgi:hypothetical protein
MSYIFKGTLCGVFCDECEELLGNVTVRIYPMQTSRLWPLRAPTTPSRCSPTIK